MSDLLRKAVILAILASPAMAQDTTRWIITPDTTATETTQPNGDRTIIDKDGRVWTERNGILLGPDGHGCSHRGPVTSCW